MSHVEHTYSVGLGVVAVLPKVAMKTRCQHTQHGRIREEILPCHGDPRERPQLVCPPIGWRRIAEQANTRVARLRVTWMAIGVLPDEQDFTL